MKPKGRRGLCLDHLQKLRVKGACVWITFEKLGVKRMMQGKGLQGEGGREGEGEREGEGQRIGGA